MLKTKLKYHKKSGRFRKKETNKLTQNVDGLSKYDLKPRSQIKKYNHRKLSCMRNIYDSCNS